MAQWRSGAVAQWRSGAVAQWRSGAVAQWRSGTVAQWRSGAVAQWLEIRTLDKGNPSKTKISLLVTGQMADISYGIGPGVQLPTQRITRLPCVTDYPLHAMSALRSEHSPC